MKVVREEPDFVVWCCQRCTEIAGVAAIQVRVLPRGRARGRYALGRQEAENHRFLPPQRVLPADIRNENEKPEKSLDEAFRDAARDPSCRF